MYVRQGALCLSHKSVLYFSFAGSYLLFHLTTGTVSNFLQSRMILNYLCIISGHASCLRMHYQAKL